MRKKLNLIFVLYIFLYLYFCLIVFLIFYVSVTALLILFVWNYGYFYLKIKWGVNGSIDALNKTGVFYLSNYKIKTNLIYQIYYINRNDKTL